MDAPAWLVKALVLGLLLAPTASPTPEITAVVPVGIPAPAEGVQVACTAACDLSGWALDDDEDRWTFPPGSRLSAGDAMWVVRDAGAWQALGVPAWPALTLRLADHGETVNLLDPAGAVRDTMAWGAGTGADLTSAGAVLKADGPTPRIHRVGESALDAPAFIASEVTLYLAPDAPMPVLLDAIGAAERRLHIHVYDLRHATLVGAVLERMSMAPDLDVQVLVDDGPVGLDARARADRAAALSALTARGATVVEAGGRYAFHHLKALVADDAVLVQSENWVPHGVPETGSWGNRGMGIRVDSPGLADWMATWMEADRSAWDARPWQGTGPAPAIMPPREGPHTPLPAVTVAGPVAVRPVISPDHTAYAEVDPVLDLMQAAEQRILGQQMTLRDTESNRLGWQASDRYTAALDEAHARGIEVAVQVGRTADMPARPWLRPFDHPHLSLHNKAWVIDDALVVGSMNGNHASRSENREVSLIIDDERAADAAAAWMQADAPSQAAPLWPSLFAAVLVAVAWSRRDPPSPVPDGHRGHRRRHRHRLPRSLHRRRRTGHRQHLRPHPGVVRALGGHVRPPPL